MEFAFDHYELNGQPVEGGSPQLILTVDNDLDVLAVYRQVINPDTQVSIVGFYTVWLAAETQNYYVKDMNGVVVQTGFLTQEDAENWARQQGKSNLPLFAIGGFVLYSLFGGKK